MYDLAILGGGAAAFAAAYRARQLGKRVVMVNDGLPIGGTCVNVGCMPSKIMIEKSKHLKGLSKEERRARFEDDLRETLSLVENLRNENYASVAEELGIDVVDGFGKLNGKEIIVKNESFSSEKILIATGSRPNIPSIEGLEKYYTNRTLFLEGKAIKKDSVSIIGAGPQGIEFSWLFHNYGFKVNIFQRSERILKRLDSDISMEMEMIMRKAGMNVITNARIEKVRNGKIIESNREFVGDIFVAAGIKPNTEGVGLDSAGVEVDDRGFIKVNEFLETTAEGIYAAGDVTGIMPLETVAAKQGKTAVENMFSGRRKTIDYDSIPQAVFSTPPIGVCGQTEREGLVSRILPMERVERTHAIGNKTGFIKMVVEGRRVVGIDAIGERADEIANIASYIISNGMTIDDIRNTTMVFPTMGEAVKKVAQAFDETSKMPCCIE